MARVYIDEVLDYGFHNSTSPGISARLEREFAAKFGVGYAILHSNGTATMHAALLAAGVGAGDEVIVPGLTMASTAARSIRRWRTRPAEARAAVSLETFDYVA